MLNLCIAFSRHSEAEVRGLINDLTALGHRVGFADDQRAARLSRDEALARIRSCDALLIALTPQTLQSEACCRHMRHAHALGKPLIAVELGAPMAHGALPVPIDSSQILSYRRRDAEAPLRLHRALEPLGAPLRLPAGSQRAAARAGVRGDLKARIAARGKLLPHEQATLLGELAIALRSRNASLEVRQQLLALRRRPDLMASTVHEIDLLLRKTAATHIKLRPPFLLRPELAGSLGASAPGETRQARAPAASARRAAHRPAVDAPEAVNNQRARDAIGAVLVAAASSWLVAASVPANELDGLRIGNVAVTGLELVTLVGIVAAIIAALSLTVLLSRRRPVVARQR